MAPIDDVCCGAGRSQDPPLALQNVQPRWLHVLANSSSHMVVMIPMIVMPIMVVVIVVIVMNLIDDAR